MILNLLLIFILSVSALLFLFYIGKKNISVPEEEEGDSYSIPYLVREVKNIFESILNKNIADFNLNKQETVKREKIKSLIRKNLRSCGFGDGGAKEFVKDYIKEILQKDLGVKEDNIDRIIPFHNSVLLTVRDKFEIVLYLYKKQYQYDALAMLINTYHLAEPKPEAGARPYEISGEDMEGIYDAESIHLHFIDKLEILAQRIYQSYKGFGVIDEIRDMKIDGVSGGISGIPFDSYTYHAESFDSISYRNLNAYNSIWLFFQGKTIHLSFLGFETQNELVRVCKNIYRYGNPGQLSEERGYIANDMKDGSRVITFRPPFSDRWAFFVRKHDSIMDMDIHNIITDEGNELLIEILKWMVRGCLVIVITGEMGSGKTTLLKLLIQYIRRTYTLRIHEQIFELNLSKVYQDFNILTLRETDTVSGQEALDIMKKTDGTVIILGEVASHTAANWLIETSQISKMTICSHHAGTTQDLIDNLKIAQLRAGGFHNEFLAEEQVVKAINVDIHMENDDGHRYISGITEIVPLTEKDYPVNFVPSVLEYMKMYTDRKAYKTIDIVRFENGKYILKNAFSKRAESRILSNLNEGEKGEFIKLFHSGIKEDAI